MSVAWDSQTWAEQQFGGCCLGDVRRTRRLVQFAGQVAADPDASTPQQTERWSDLKAAYRLLDQRQVTFEAITAPHVQQTRARPSGTWLILDDTTEIDFGATNQALGLGPLGQGFGRGFLLHSGLMVHPETADVIGLAGQLIRYRKPAPKRETRRRRLNRDRESLNWGRLIDQVGTPPPGARFVHVCDRGADNYEVYCHLLLTRQDWVIRAAHGHRRVIDQGQEVPLATQVQQWPVDGTYELSWRSATQGPRTAQIEVRRGTILMAAPRQSSPWLKEQGLACIGMNVVEAREVHAPPGVAPLHWTLLTSLPIPTFQDAWTVLGYYEKRSLIEEFHKALKTGCRVQERQYEDHTRLEAITGLLSVVAVRLLQLRAIARTAPDRPAAEVVPSAWLSVLRRRRPNRPLLTVGQCFREIAGLGGHLLRRGDGEPGWLTLWRGFKKLQRAVAASHDDRGKCG